MAGTVGSGFLSLAKVLTVLHALCGLLSVATEKATL